MIYSRVNKKDKIALSRLGLNFYRVFINKSTRMYLSDIIETIDYTIESIEKEDECIYHDICDSYFFKKRSLFAGLINCRENIYPTLVINSMKTKESKDILIERLKLIRFILTTTFANYYC